MNKSPEFYLFASFASFVLALVAINSLIEAETFRFAWGARFEGFFLGFLAFILLIISGLFFMVFKDLQAESSRDDQ
jgi:hypothetical protein